MGIYWVVSTRQDQSLACRLACLVWFMLWFHEVCDHTETHIYIYIYIYIYIQHSIIDPPLRAVNANAWGCRGDYAEGSASGVGMSAVPEMLLVCNRQQVDNEA